MNKKSVFRRSVSLILTLVMVITLLPGMKAEAATAIKVTNLTGSTKQLTKGSTFTLKTNYSKSKLSFKSSKTSVATVSSTGKITAKAAGTAKVTITVKANKKVKKTITVKVVKNPAISISNVSDSTLTIYQGDTFTLKTNYKASELSFESSNETSAPVSSTGVISANSCTDCFITITLKKDKTVSKTIRVIVENAPIEITNVSDSPLILLRGDTFTLETNYKASELNFESSNEVSVPVSSTGVISANYCMDCFITITLKRDETVSKKIRVIVENGGSMPENSGYFREIFDGSGSSSYMVIFKESGYDDMVFRIDGLSMRMLESRRWTGFISNDDDALCFENLKSFKNVANVGEFTDEEILNIWKSDSEDFIWGFTNETKVYRTEDENYIRICFEDNDDRDYRCLTIQNKNTGKIANIIYITQCGEYSAEEVFRKFESVTVGDFTEEDLRK